MATKPAARSGDNGPDDGYEGPGRLEALETAADFEEFRFAQMQAMSGCGAVLRGWERRGGDKKDIQDLYAMRDMTIEEVMAELRRINRTISWKLDTDDNSLGQADFFRAFEPPQQVTGTGIGAAPIGSRLSKVRAKVSGFNEGKAKGSGSMQDGLAPYLNDFGWEPDCAEALAYAEGYGEGLKLRPPPKAPKDNDGQAADEQTEGGASDTPPVPTGEKPATRGRGRPRKSESALAVMTARAAAMPATTLNDEIAEELQGADARPGWQGDSDFSEDPPGPVH